MRSGVHYLNWNYFSGEGECTMFKKEANRVEDKFYETKIMEQYIENGYSPIITQLRTGCLPLEVEIERYRYQHSFL